MLRRGLWVGPAAVVVVGLAVFGAAAAQPTAPVAASAAAGHYDRLCLACHGTAGDGQGPAAPWLWPPPRDLTSGRFKWRSTPLGAAATDDDLATTIRHGAPGTSMPAFGDVLADAEIDALVALVRGFGGGAPALRSRARRRRRPTVIAPS
ncbi:MAG: cytochrome c [Kofleriaceae bacterium]